MNRGKSSVGCSVRDVCILSGLIITYLLFNGIPPIKQGVALTGRNRTGPPCSVGHPTAYAPGPAAADRPRARWPARPPASSVIQTTTDDDDDSKQNNTGPLGGPAITKCDKKLSYRSGTMQCAMSVEILSTAVQLYKKWHFKRLTLGMWPWNSLKVTGNDVIQYAVYHFPSVVCSNKVVI